MADSQRDELLGAIASTIADYRAGEILPVSTYHVDRWIQQFEASVQVSILSEVQHVLDKVYVPKSGLESFLDAVCKQPDLSADWRLTNFLNIQKVGHSQHEMLSMFSACLQRNYGYGIQHCGASGGPFIYLDDATFSGHRALTDLKAWLPSAPATATLHIIVIAFHAYGQFDFTRKFKEACANANKQITVRWWRCAEFEDRRAYTDDSDVLRPTEIPAGAEVAAYVQSLGAQYPLVLRGGSSIGKKSLFSSGAARHLLEQEFVKQGVRIRAMCPNLNAFQRPLGNTTLSHFGFGSMLVTYRNCPNNCPLVFWAGDPWYPLFPRKTN